VRSGGYHRAGRPPLVPGVEGSGTVLRVGIAVPDLSVGDRVIAFRGRPGFYAERVAVSRRHVVRSPVGLDLAAAAALPTAWLSAWYCLRHLAAVQPGEHVVVHAAASGVGDAAVQIAKHLGAIVTGVVTSPDKVHWVRRIGADHVTHQGTVEAPAAVRAITGGRGADVVLDTVGGPSFGHALRSVAPSGRVVAMANVALEPSTIDTRDFYPRNVTIHGFQITDLIDRGYDPRTDLADLADLVAAGALTVHIDRTLPLTEAAIAHEHVAGRRNRGKVILRP